MLTSWQKVASKKHHPAPTNQSLMLALTSIQIIQSRYRLRKLRRRFKVLKARSHPIFSSDHQDSRLSQSSLVCRCRMEIFLWKFRAARRQRHQRLRKRKKRRAKTATALAKPASRFRHPNSKVWWSRRGAHIAIQTYSKRRRWRRKVLCRRSPKRTLRMVTTQMIKIRLNKTDKSWKLIKWHLWPKSRHQWKLAVLQK